MSVTDTNTINTTSHLSSMSDLSVPSRMREAGLSTKVAMEHFAQIVCSTVKSCTNRHRPISAKVKLYSILHLLLYCSIVLLIYHDCRESDNRSLLILKILLVLLVGGLELYRLINEHHFGRKFAQLQRIQQCLKKTCKSKYSYGVPSQIPLLSKHKFVRVYRDGMLRLCPATLLVAGDVIQLLEGEPEPCRVKPATSTPTKECIVLESPIVKLIEQFLADSTNETAPTISVYHLLLTVSILIVPLNYVQRSQLHQVVILILLLRADLFNTLLSTWTCARFYLVADALKKSKTPYDESLDTDEFDEEAPPPSKEINIKPLQIIKRCISILTSSMDDQKDIVEVLDKMSVMCFTDREGPISVALPAASEIVHLQDLEKVSCSAVEEWSMDSTKFARLCQHHAEYNRLKPLGLATISCSSCNPTGSHRRFAVPEEYGMHVTSQALQACQCAIGKSMGIEAIHSDRLDLLNIQWIKNANDPIIVFTYSDRLQPGTWRCFAVGPLSCILDHCSEYYVDGGIIDLTASVKRALRESEEGSTGRDEECIAYAHQTVLDGHGHFDANEFCFLGSLTCSPQPRDDMQEFIDDVMNAGIRFVYLGEEGERQCKTFASRLGLETDWNGCILLSREDNRNYTDPSDIKARLPVGVHQIRHHLKHVDDIPLHVSVFAECGDEATMRDMVRIYQDYGETVAVVISGLNPDHLLVSSMADLCISMEPTPLHTEGTWWEVASEWHSLSASLHLSFDSSPYILTDLVKEARTLHRGRQSANSFFRFASAYSLLHSNRTLGLALTLSLSISVNAMVSYEEDVLKLMPVKDAKTVDYLQCIGWLLAAVIARVDEETIWYTLPLLALSHLHPVRPLHRVLYSLFTHRPIMISSLLLLYISILFMHPWRALLSLPPLLLLELTKYMHSIKYWESQKRSKLEFSTRLGMHSPL